MGKQQTLPSEVRRAEGKEATANLWRESDAADV